MLGHHQHTSEVTGGHMMAYLQWYLDPLSPHQLKKVKRKKKVIKVGPDKA